MRLGRNTEDEWLSLILEDGSMGDSCPGSKSKTGEGLVHGMARQTRRAGQQGLEEHVESFQS